MTLVIIFSLVCAAVLFVSVLQIASVLHEKTVPVERFIISVICTMLWVLTAWLFFMGDIVCK